MERGKGFIIECIESVSDNVVSCFYFQMRSISIDVIFPLSSSVHLLIVWIHHTCYIICVSAGHWDISNCYQVSAQQGG